MRNIFYVLFFVQTAFAAYYSQRGQDQYVHEHFFPDLKGGVFVDIGAYDGIFLSNTYFFEKEMNWKGICIEPIPEIFAQLERNRNAICIQGCISVQPGIQEFLRITGMSEMLSGLVQYYDPRHIERIDRELALFGGRAQRIQVDCLRLEDLLDQHGIREIDFLSIDTEGGEFEILQSLDFSKFKTRVIAVENNYGDPRIAPYLENQGFQLAEILEQDMIFVRMDI